MVLSPRTTAGLLLALFASGPARAETPRGAGPVVLLGGRAAAAEVPELANAGGPAVLLSPYANLDCARLAEQVLGQGASCFHVRPGDLDRSNARELVSLVRGARSIGLWGGDQHDWFDVFWPAGRRSALLDALLEAWRGGATVAGQGAPVAFLSAASVWDFSLPTEPPLRRPASPPHDLDDPVLAWNLGLQPWAAVDTASRSKGSAWDLVDLLVAERLRLGAYLEADSALVFDPGGPELRARGKGAVWLFDLRKARRGERSLQGARFSMLAEGDTWSQRWRRVDSDTTWLPPGDRDTRLEGGPVLRALAPAEVADWDHPPDPELLDQNGFGPLARWAFAGREPARTLLLNNGSRGAGRLARLVLALDERSRVGRREQAEAGPPRATLANLRLDLEWDL